MKRALLLCLAWPLLATAAEYPDLPPAEMAEKVLRAHPAVRAALAGVDVGEAQRDQWQAGPHEFNLRLGGAQRRDREADRRLREREVGIERAIRLPGKAAKDAAIGDSVLAEARHSHGDALHETARLLLRRWFDWRRESAAAEEWRLQAELLARQLSIAEKRVTAGDAARIEALLAAAQHTQAEARRAEAESRVAVAAGELAVQFPALVLPARVPVAAPAAIEQGFDAWRDRILEHSHELQVARSAAQRQQLQAQRADADRLPDPTVGVRWASERDGQERLVGLQLSFPLPGEARAATARAATAETAAAAAREALVLSKVEAEARRSYQLAQATHAQWQRLADVATRMDENVRLLDKAWRLGEGQIADLLNARRQSAEARLAAVQAALDAAEARYRLLLDTHRLWPLDSDPES